MKSTLQRDPNYFDAPFGLLHHFDNTSHRDIRVRPVTKHESFGPGVIRNQEYASSKQLGRRRATNPIVEYANRKPTDVGDQPRKCANERSPPQKYTINHILKLSETMCRRITLFHGPDKL